VWAWGSNAYGQVGDGTETQRDSPVQVIGLTGTLAVASGAYHSLALKADGSAWAWGYNHYGQLGTGFTNDSDIAVQISNLSGVSAIAAGDNHSLALAADG
jgi:alpha-tubulin suppressor-like RCC1 family protein